MSIDYVQQSWGVYVNSTSYGSARSIPKDCLTWVKPVDKDKWQKRGVVVWHNEAQRVEAKSAGYALQLLEYMHTNDIWKENGIPITRQYIQLLPTDTPKKRQSRKKGENQPSVEKEESKSETVIEESFRLTPEESAQLMQTLEANEPSLRQMADEDEKHKSRVMGQVYSFLLRGARMSEGNEIDFSARSFKWEQEPDKLNWICDRPPNRGSAVVTEDNFFWRGCIECPDRFKRWSSYFVNLQEALSWVEQELEKIEQESDEVVEPNPWKRVPVADLIAQRREKLADYWIEPATIEPNRVTYRAMIDLEYEPYDYKTWEMSFGKKYRHSKKFASPTQLARELQLDSQLDIEQLFNGWYRLFSRVIYYREDIAIAQAQQFWEKSTIVQQHRAGKVVRAQYGYEEVEIRYQVMIGGCENPERPYPPEKSREEHLERLALRETLIYALDLEGFRLFLGLSPGDISDEELLDTMHTQRADSPQVPLEEQMESERWLRTYGAKRVLRRET